ncbi:MAG: T9SS type A sorting domain-containing protein [Melioribacteraceae bacterium]|nr:T9SS type A sorting domain-containing protein [Melioribacteraceae bacterium]
MRFLIVMILFISSNLFSQENKEGSLIQLVENIKTAMPARDSNGFVKPTSEEQNKFAEVISFIVNQQHSSADSAARLFSYILYDWKDTENNGKEYYVLMEPKANESGGVTRGWGTYIFNENGNNDVVIEVPHPRWDSNTWQVGFRAFQQLNSQYFLLSGTHRYANGRYPAPADPAHNTENIFYTVHTQLAPKANHAIQIHGFSRSNSKYDGYPDVVISNGTSNPSAILDSLKTEITTDGYSVGIFDGVNYSHLGARTNTEGFWSNMNNLSFIHIEMEYFIRASDSEWENILGALSRTFNTSTAIDDDVDLLYPQEFVLKQNYPNPFNPSTKIKYQLPSRGFVNLTVYNILGIKIASLVNKEQLPGLYSVEFNPSTDGKGLSSGVYFYKLSFGRNSISKKMIYLK